MSAGIRSDGSGTYAAIQFGGSDSAVFDSSGLRAASGKSIAATAGPGASQMAWRNLCFNGDMELWQSGESFNNLSGYGPDGFIIGHGVGASNTGGKNTLTFDTLPDGAQARYSCDIVHTSGGGANTFGNFKHPIEDVTRTAGREVTVSFWIFCSAADAGKKIAIEFAQYFGTGGSPSAEVNSLGVAQFTLAEGWQKIKHTTTFPNIIGKTLGTDNNNYSYAMVWFDAGSTFNGRTLSLGPQSIGVSITRWQVEFGPIATPFEFRPKGVDLAIAQRYYAAGILQSLAACYATGNWLIPRIMFPQEMRAIPTMTVTATSPAGLVGAWTPQPDTKGFRTVKTVAGVKGDDDFIDGTWTASARL